MAWTDHAAAMEEGVAARDDLRTSLGQPYVLRRCTELAGQVHARFATVVRTRGRHRSPHRHAAPRRPRGHGPGRRRPRRRRPPLDRLAGDAVPGDHDVRRPGRPARPTPARPPGRLRRGDPAARADGLRRRARGRAGRCPTDPLSVRFADLHFAYAHGTFALSGVDLAVPAGTTCALVGRTGSGKSTLASLLSRAVEPEPGSLLLGGVDVRELDLQQLRAAVGVVTQRTEILAGTLSENITLFADLPRATVEAAVDELGLTAWVAGLPRGLDTLLGPGGHQPVAPARSSWSPSPGCWSATSGSSCSTRRPPGWTRSPRRAWSRAADRLLSGRTGLLVAHRLSTTERAEQVAVLDGGRVLQHGPRDELAHRDGPFRDLLDGVGRRVGAATGRRRAARPARSAPDAVRVPPPPAPALRPHPLAWRAPPRTRCSSSRSGAWSAWACSWSVRAHRRVRRDHRLAVGPHRRRPPARRAPLPLTALLVVSLDRVARCCWRSRSAAIRSGGSR